MNTLKRSPGLLRGCAALVAMLTTMLSAATGAVASPSDQAVNSDTGAAATTVSAQWQAYELNFHYFGFTAYYSCNGLADRLKEVLRDLGADADVHVSASGCFGANDIGKSISAHIQVKMPSTQTNDPKVMFPATSKTVALRTSRAGETGSGDCELLEQVRDQLLPVLKLQLVQDDLRCVPGQATLGARGLKVVALIATPVKHE